LDDRLHCQYTRHASASWLLQSGATLYEVQRLLGHSAPTVTEISALTMADRVLLARQGIELRLRCFSRPEPPLALLLDYLALKVPERLEIKM
jgi:integrase